MKKEGPLTTTDESSLFYNKYSLIEFKNVGKYMDILQCQDIIIIYPFNQLTPRKSKKKQKKRTLYNNAENFIQ